MASLSFVGHVWSDVEIARDGNKRTADPYRPVTSDANRRRNAKEAPRGRDGQIVWGNAVAFMILHAIGAYGFYLEIFGHIQRKTIVFSKYHPHYTHVRSVNLPGKRKFT